jgi:hypothetical protein
MTRLRVMLVVSVVTACTALLASASVASASYGRLAKYQITFSQNCDNPAFCLGGQGGLGGTWGWAVLNSDGTSDLQITFCGHAPGQGGGAGHEAVDINAWSIDSANGVFFFNSTSDPSFEGDTPIPAAPGHYSMHPAPGVAMEITVVKIPNR